MRIRKQRSIVERSPRSLRVSHSVAGPRRPPDGVELTEWLGHVRVCLFQISDELVRERQPALRIALRREPSLDGLGNVSSQDVSLIGWIYLLKVRLEVEQHVETSLEVARDHRFIQTLVHAAPSTVSSLAGSGGRWASRERRTRLEIRFQEVTEPAVVRRRRLVPGSH